MITSMYREVQRFPHPFKIEQKYWFIKNNYLTRINIFFEFYDNWSRFVTHLTKSLKHFSLRLMLFSVQFYNKLHLFQLIVTARRYSTFVLSNHWVGSSFTYYVPARLWRWKQIVLSLPSSPFNCSWRPIFLCPGRYILQNTVDTSTSRVFRARPPKIPVLMCKHDAIQTLAVQACLQPLATNMNS